MATHTQTGRACEEQCIPIYHALIDEKKIERRRERENNNGTRKKRRREKAKKMERAEHKLKHKRGSSIKD